LLRNGCSVPEAQRLARHSDVRLTMRYTHIGIQDQAKAVANLPSPKRKLDQARAKGGADALQMRCISGVFDGQSVSQSGKTADPGNEENPCRSNGFGQSCHLLATGDKVEDRGLEPLTSCMPCKRSPN